MFLDKLIKVWCQTFHWNMELRSIKQVIRAIKVLNWSHFVPDYFFLTNYMQGENIDLIW